MKASAFFHSFLKPLKNIHSGRFFICLLIFFFLFFSFHSFSQKDSSTVKPHSPKKAAIMSACLPGLGQIYNKKYWKLPIIYGGAAAFTYLAMLNSDSLSKYKEAYILRTDGDSTTIDIYNDKYTAESLLQIKNYYRRNLELTCIFAFAVYALQIIDATVDAHLFDFDVDENLSMKISPIVLCSAGKYSTGLSFKFKIGPNKSKLFR